MTKPIIGITANVRPNPAHEDINWSYAPSGFVEGVQRAGGLAILLPVSDPSEAKTYISMIDKLILIGGQNVDPKFYNERTMPVKMTSSSNVISLKWHLSKKPLSKETHFSICRGTQLMNVALGGSLHQDIENHWQDKPSDYLYHEMIVEEDSKLAEIYGLETSINSFHHQSIKHLASDLRVIARDPEDNTVEAIESNTPDLRYLGVQWHPELLLHKREEDLKLFEYVVNEL
ncbi:MAG: gamma-glutamyl-gamma-aminobutyrate hydrolase family protein [Streptococcus sp.]